MTLAEKYPDAYLEHFIAMFNGELTAESFREHAGQAMQYEGKEYLVGLLDELHQIEKNNDLEKFVEQIEIAGIPGFTLEMMLVIKEEITSIIG